MARVCSKLALVFLLTSACLPAQAQDKAPAGPDQLQRLSALCKVWGTIRYLHPFLAYKDIDWDAALVKALPKVEAANSHEEFAAAVQAMLDELHDPATRVVRKQRPPRAAPQAPEPKARPGGEKWFTRLADGTLVIDVSTLPDLPLTLVPVQLQPLTELRTEITKARGLIIDCRRVAHVTPQVQQLGRVW
jgi:hypothetical protein